MIKDDISLKRFMRGSCEQYKKLFIFREAQTGRPYCIPNAKIIYRSHGDRWEWIVIKNRIKYTFRMVGTYPRDAYSLEEISILLPRKDYRAFNRRAGRVRH